MYGAYAGRRTRTHDHGGTVHACKPHGLHCRGVNRISARQGKYTQKPRAMQINLQWPRRDRGVNRISAEGKHRRSREWHGVPRKEGTSARFVPEESATVSRQIGSLSPEGRARDAGRMAVEPRARLYHGGKCYGFTANRFTSPPKNTTLHWQMLFMKISGAAANC